MKTLQKVLGGGYFLLTLYNTTFKSEQYKPSLYLTCNEHTRHRDNWEFSEPMVAGKYMQLATTQNDMQNAAKIIIMLKQQ